MLKTVSLWDKALSLLTRRDYGRAELAKRLEQLRQKQLLDEHKAAQSGDEPMFSGADAEVFKAQARDEVEAIILRLLDYGYLNDERVSATLVRQGVAKGQGPRRISAELKYKSLNPTALNDVEDDVDWMQQAREVRTRRFGEALPETPKEKARQLRFLLYRGFSQSQAMAAMQVNEWES
ncbi:regulatory protein RecX [Pokkaliibacter sp. CJK22405]|uniref:regulatory protein RecX n=1 Tax=Pokkaliibacter sp. CJK22405 TaxID=3384615 RepID=UPI00398526A4